ncbi:hypothetical protein ACQP1W_50770 [Spirillospora sp. CA-255316]
MAERNLEPHADLETIDTSGLSLAQLTPLSESVLVNALIEMKDPARPGRGPLGGGFNNDLIGF